jgi:hypothetical protein
MATEKDGQLAARLVSQLYERSIPQARCEYWITLCDAVPDGGVLEISQGDALKLRALLAEAWDAFNSGDDL